MREVLIDARLSCEVHEKIKEFLCPDKKWGDCKNEVSEFFMKMRNNLMEEHSDWTEHDILSDINKLMDDYLLTKKDCST